jgi:hypothetical protein
LVGSHASAGVAESERPKMDAMTSGAIRRMETPPVFRTF